MKVVNDRAIVLKTKRPHLVTELIDRYKIITEQDGVYKIAVPWELPEAQALASLKIKDVPSPMQRDYQFTGKYSPLPTRRTQPLSLLCIRRVSVSTNRAQVRLLQ